MKKYIVHVEEVWIQGYEIEAKSKKDAVIKFRGGEGDIIENDFDLIIANIQKNILLEIGAVISSKIKDILVYYFL